MRLCELARERPGLVIGAGLGAMWFPFYTASFNGAWPFAWLVGVALVGFGLGARAGS